MADEQKSPSGKEFKGKPQSGDENQPGSGTQETEGSVDRGEETSGVEFSFKLLAFTNRGLYIEFEHDRRTGVRTYLDPDAFVNPQDGQGLLVGDTYTKQVNNAPLTDAILEADYSNASEPVQEEEDPAEDPNASNQ